MLNSVLMAAITFVSTNLDDLLLLTFYYAQTDRQFKSKHIVLGQYIGIGFLTGLSLLLAKGIGSFAKAHLSLLGFVPLAMGLKMAWEAARDRGSEREAATEADLSLEQEAASGWLSGAGSKLHPKVMLVAGVTIAGGGDNIGVYAPVFATIEAGALFIYLVVFALLTGVWCGLGRAIAAHPKVESAMRQIKTYAVPAVFMALGLMILLKK